MIVARHDVNQSRCRNDATPRQCAVVRIPLFLPRGKKQVHCPNITIEVIISLLQNTNEFWFFTEILKMNTEFGRLNQLDDVEMASLFY